MPELRAGLAAVCLGCCLAAAASGQAAKERGEAPQAAPVQHQGVRYEAIQWGQARGLEQNGGYVQAVDAANGSILWIHRIYRIAYDPAKEQDKQDRFITRLAIGERGESLLIDDERGGRYVLDLRTHRVTAPGQ